MSDAEALKKIIIGELKTEGRFYNIRSRGKSFWRHHCGQRMEKFEGTLGFTVISPGGWVEIFVCPKCGYAKIIETDAVGRFTREVNLSLPNI